MESVGGPAREWVAGREGGRVETRGGMSSGSRIGDRHPSARVRPRRAANISGISTPTTFPSPTPKGQTRQRRRGASRNRRQSHSSSLFLGTGRVGGLEVRIRGKGRQWLILPQW